MLDVGCGAGAALRELAELHPEAVLTGCDISPLAIETASALNESYVKAGRMRFLRCGVPDLPFEDGAFDTVFSVESLYFWPDAQAGLKEIRRVLAPGGAFMTVLEMVGGMMDERQLAIVEHLKMVCPTREKLEDLMVSAGFDDDVFDTVFSVESLYFWPDQLAGLREIRRVLVPGGWFMTALEMVGGMMNERQRAIVEHLKMACPTQDELRGLMTGAGFADVTVELEPEHRWLCAAGRK